MTRMLKMFTAAALLKLQDKKKLSLDDPLAKFWPKAKADKKSVTVRHLLNHTSGIQAGFKGEWKFDSRKRESLEELVLDLPMESKPGETFQYTSGCVLQTGRGTMRSNAWSRRCPARRSSGTASRSCFAPRG